MFQVLLGRDTEDRVFFDEHLQLSCRIVVEMIGSLSWDEKMKLC